MTRRPGKTAESCQILPRWGFDAASADHRFAAVAACGMILRDSDYKGTASLPQVAELAGSTLGHDAGGYGGEFLDLVRRAEASE
jgi:Ca-activated chloride channel family protein